ncbi:chitin-binding protein [Chromobacterium sinusclupearum]|uniref:Chitin-binding protein n=1 Tax=Chromobacterium sinusclupearum TaxID=2077146 RepID=A0A2K4MKK7_9NEIS|nr:lytic polysaccharide monooxygenase [Chromobacterium sinusclupearum]POA97608.1 chitin-binding protein [Chromobacterium sinusclupearum]
MKPYWHLSVMVLSSLSAQLWAHGTMERPLNRVYGCYLEGPEAPKSKACQDARQIGGTQAMYDWNGINQNPSGDQHQAVVPDGTLCGGGKAEFRGFNQPRADWPATRIVPDAKGNYEFVYRATAPHATQYFRFYITRDGWRPEQPLKWSDLELFGTINGTPRLDGDKRYRMTLPLPAGKSGRHIIYNVWKRSDSEEAFYSCSDVMFDTDGQTPGAKPPLANPWKEIGNVVAHEDLPANSTVTLRVFDALGHDAESHSVKLTPANAGMANWPYELARKVNATSRAIRIGVASQRQRQVVITPVQSASANRVYLNDGYPGYGYNIDLKKGNGGIVPPLPANWREGAPYRAGQLVSYQGRSYRCLQPHTATVGSGWTPSSQPALWQAL